MNKRNAIKWSAIGLGILLLAAGVGTVAFLATPAPLLPEAEAALYPGDDVRLDRTDGWLAFSPAIQEPAAGLIFYPGGRVPPAAYAPAAAEIAARGYLAVIVPMPVNLAVLGIERAAEVQAAYPEIEHWAIGGHSLGGAMAAEFAARHPGGVSGLLLWDSYPSSDLSSQDLQVVSVYRAVGADRFASAGVRERMPDAVTFIAIRGGNHEQFGYYTGQAGDVVATITREEQQEQAVAAAVALLAAIDSP